MPKSDFVIIGGVAAGCKTAATLMRRLPNATVTLFEKGKHLSFAACGMPYFASGDIESFEALTQTAYGIPRDPDFFRDSRGFEAVTGAEVIGIRRDDKIVSVRKTATGEVFEHGYGKLIIATGASPVPPPFPVADAETIGRFHVPGDAIAFRRMAEQGKIGKAVIIGGGFIGCELAEAVGGLWGIETILIEREDQLLPGMLDSEMAALVRQELRSQDVVVMTDHTVEKTDLDQAGKPIVSVRDMEDIAADYVFLALGLRPEVALAQECGLEIGSSGAIAVDSTMKTSDPDIYAGGDCVESIHQITGQTVNLCLGSLANRHGRVIAENLAGREATFPGVLGTQLLKVYDISVGAVGLTEKSALETGFDVRSVWGAFSDKPDYQPESKPVVLKMTYEADSKRLLGLQAAGPGDTYRRIDVFASFLHQKASVDDLLDFEHGYTPPFSEALDPLHHLAAIAQAQEKGANLLNPAFDFGNVMKEQAQIVDVREKEEAAAKPLPPSITDTGIRIVQIPLGQLRNRLGEIERARRILLVCHRGLRSYQASLILKAASFDEVDVLGGGLQARAD